MCCVVISEILEVLQDLDVGTKATEGLLELASAPHPDFPLVVPLPCDPAILPGCCQDRKPGVPNAQDSRAYGRGCSRSNRGPHETFNILIVCPNCGPHPPLLHFCPQLLPLNSQPCTRVPSCQETKEAFEEVSFDFKGMTEKHG